MPVGGRTQAEPNLMRYLRVLREHVMLIVACTVVALAVAATYTRLAPRHYRAQAEMLVSPANGSDAGLAALPVLHSTSDPTRDILTAAGLIASPRVARATIAALHLDESPTHLLGRVTVTPIGQSNLLALQATARTAKEAQTVVNQFATQVIATRTASLHAALDALIPQLQAQLNTEPAATSNANVALASELSELRVLRARPDPTMSLADSAGLPAAPYSPRTILALGGGLLAGLVLGIGGAFLVDALDPRLRREDQLRHQFDTPIMANIPRERFRRRKKQPLLPSQLSFAANEGYRALPILLGARAGHASRAILVTGSAPSEGKTTTALSLATALAQTGARVILIEADLRRPVIARTLQLTVECGTDDLVAGTGDLDRALIPVIANGAELRVVPVRVANDQMAERLSFDFCEQIIGAAKHRADFVVIDAPPISAVVDALPMAKFVDDVLILARIGVTRLAQLSELYSLLMNFGTRPLGFVVVGGSPGRSPYYGGSVSRPLFAREL